MVHKLHKIIPIVLIVTAIFSSTPSNVLADSGLQPPSPNVPIDCGVWAYNPSRSGSNVNGKGEVSCSSNHASLKVTAGLRDWTGRYTTKTKTCYNAIDCNITATLSYSSGRQWQTDVSGYVNDIPWQAYYATNWVSIP